MTTLEQRVRSGEITPADAARLDMEAFERLPAGLRKFIREAPIEILATDAERVLRECGSEAFTRISLAAYVEQVRREHPIAQGPQPGRVEY